MIDSQITIEEIKQDIHQFCIERDWDQYHHPKDLAIGAATEAAELLEIFRFKTDEECERLLGRDGDASVRQNVADELADVLFFVVRMAQKYDFDLGQAFRQKMEKNRTKYPVDKARGSNKKYTEYEK